MIEKSQAQALVGAEVRTSDGARAGAIAEVHLDADYDEPEWILVGGGAHRTFVPAAEARLEDDGVVTVPYSRRMITSAPEVGDPAHLSEAEERALYDHYEIGYESDDSPVRAGGRHVDHDRREPDEVTQARERRHLAVGGAAGEMAGGGGGGVAGGGDAVGGDSGGAIDGDGDGSSR